MLSPSFKPHFLLLTGIAVAMLAGYSLAAEPEGPVVIFDSDFALPAIPGGDGPGTPVCIDSSGLLIAGCDAVDICDLENRIYAVLPEFVRSEACVGGLVSTPVLISADGPYSDTQAVEDVWLGFAVLASDFLNEQDCIVLSGLGCEDFYKAVFTDMGIASLLRYQITASADPGVALFLYSSAACTAPTLHDVIRQALEDYVSANGVGTYLALVLAEGGYDFPTMLNLWDTLGVLSPLSRLPAAGPGGDIFGNIYVPDGTFSISATGKLSDQTSACSNELALPPP